MHQNSPDSTNLIRAQEDPPKNNQSLLSDALVKEEIIQTRASYAQKEISSKSRKKSVRSAHCTSLNKKDFVLKFVKKDASLIWPREMKIVNSLFKIFPNEDFWNFIQLEFKLNSLCWFLSDDGRKFLNTQYSKFIFEPAKPENFSLKDNIAPSNQDQRKIASKPLTLREFLELWKSHDDNH
jgi:hypothetical protein